MRYVKRVNDASGERLYLRKPGLLSIRLTSPWPQDGQETGSALEREVEALIKRLTPQRAAAGTLKGAVRAYEDFSPDFAGLAESTKYEYRRLLREFEEDLGDLALKEFTPAFILELRNGWAGSGHRAANVRLQVLKNVLWPAIVDGRIAGGDPFAQVPQVRRPATAPEPHRIWFDQVVEAAIGAAVAERRFGLARAIVIGRYVGARRGDLVRLTKAARVDGRVRFLTGKRKVPVDVVEDPDLTRWLAEIPASQPLSARAGRKVAQGVTPLPARHLVFTLANEPYSEDGLALELRKLIERLAAAGRIDGPDYDLHGLRHTRGVELAIAGCSDAQGAAMMGHASPSSFAQYRRQADRVRLSDDGSAKVTALRQKALKL